MDRAHSTVSFLKTGYFVVLLTSFLPATSLYTTTSSKSLTVGELIHHRITMVVPKGSFVQPPAVEDGLGSMIVKEWNTKKIENKKTDSLIFDYVITTYQPENCTIPELTFTSINEKDTLSLYSLSVPLQVSSVLPQNVSPDSIQLKALKPPMKAGKPSLLWLWILLGSVVVIVGALLLRRFIKRKPQKAVAGTPPKPPFEEAMDALYALGQKRYIENRHIREYTFELSDIFKRYIERRFSVGVTELTTDEMLAWLAQSDLDQKSRNAAEWFFTSADPVKFARFIPPMDTLLQFEKKVRFFLHETHRTEPKEQNVSQDSSQKKMGSTTTESDSTESNDHVQREDQNKIEKSVTTIERVQE